ncbi:putative nucleoside permease NupX [invertebrate metagenome]|uniref:Putative nucleoside permease NupX n=1 Tax=invertebrate metagenome TaxID=1711999 RepID=A0A2H9T987_9ZZZZ
MGQSILGMGAFCLIPILFSENRKQISFLTVTICIALQFVLAWMLLKIQPIQTILLSIGSMAETIEQASLAGTSYIFGYLGGASIPFVQSGQGSTLIIAFRILPIILVMSALSAVLFHWRIIPATIHGLSFILRKLLPVNGLESFIVASSLFFGIVEAPLLIRPYIQSMSRQALFLLMTAGMSTVAGTVLILYASQLSNLIENPIGHLIIASVISLPAAILITHLWMPADKKSNAPVPILPRTTQSTLHALVTGTEDGIRVILSVIGMMIVLFACIHIINSLIQTATSHVFSLENLLAFLLRPVAWLMGISDADIIPATQLLSTKLLFNEFVAYQQMSSSDFATMSAHSNLIIVYALCGFANCASTGLLISAISAMAPEQTKEVVALAPRAMIAGFIATCMTGTVAGIILS